MKTNLLIAVVILGSASLAFANEHAEKGNHPCKNVVAACKAAGYFKGGHKNDQKKGLWKDCVEPIVGGQSVSGVTVAPGDAQACQAKKAERAEKKKAK